MKMQHIPFAATDWAAIPKVEKPAQAGQAEPHRSTAPLGATLFIVD